MELTIAEFASFNLKSKKQILDYKGTLLDKTVLPDKNLLYLYAFSRQFVTVELCYITRLPLCIKANVPTQEIKMFIDGFDISGLVP